MNIPSLVYIGLLLVCIVSMVMVNVAKYGWKSRKWTWTFAALGVGAMLTLMIVVLSST